MASVVETLSSLVTPHVVQTLAGRLGESEAVVEKGLLGGAATVLSAIAGRANEAGFLSNLMSLVTGAGSSNILSGLNAIASGSGSQGALDLGGKLLSMVFGNQQSMIGSAVAAATGMKSGSAAGLLGMIAPMVLGLLSKKVQDDHLSGASLGSALQSESANLRGLLPPGIGSMLSDLPGAGASAAAASGGSGWLFPVVVGAALVGALLWYLNQPKAPAQEAVEHATEKTTQVAAATASAIPDAVKAAWSALGELASRKLPDGVELNLPKFGVENRVLNFIADAAKLPDKETWFDFDRLLFDTSKATLQPASEEQLHNFASILKAYPNVNIKLGGYTDNTGDKGANMKLSQARAENVMAELVKMGIAPTRLEAEGYGDQHPVADNATEEGRAKNRRISMRVTRK